MLVHLSVEGGSVEMVSLEVGPDMELQDLAALAEIETGIPITEQIMLYEGRQLARMQESLASIGLKDNDLILLARQIRRPAAPPAGFGGWGNVNVPQPGQTASAPRPAPVTGINWGSIPVPGQAPVRPAFDYHGLRNQIRSQPAVRAQIAQSSPSLVEAAMSDDFNRFKKIVDDSLAAERREKERMARILANPDSLEAQELIEEEIRAQNLQHNLETAMEHNPESFGSVIMLYIDCKVNNVPVKAFVDSGAQNTIMNAETAERCGIMRLVDKRFRGIAKGVGTAEIMGRVHLTQVQIEDVFLPCSFSVMADQSVDMLLGLDMLKRHQCVIDLKENVLRIGTTDTTTPFLAEKDLPRHAFGRGDEEEASDETKKV
eukprot:Colp12_sorted_trinity150504_noHs@9112